MTIVPVEFEHSDNRRTLKQILTANIKQVNLYQAKQGAILGDHFHKETIEYFTILKGSVIYNDSKVVCRGTTFKVDPQERHKIECVTDVMMMTFLTKPYSQGSPDIHA